jgi:2-oxoglutarate ferredoxin oxidoreductase subunit beta
VLVHDETHRTQAFLLAQIQPPNFPMAFGVLFNDPAEASYDRAIGAQNALALEQKGKGDVNALLRGGHTWTIGGE